MKEFALFIFDENCRPSGLQPDPRFRLEEHHPTPRFFNKEGVRGAVDFLLHLHWYLATGGSYSILYVYDGERPVHYSYVFPPFGKFAFLRGQDLAIGPSWTAPEYRGKGIYPAVLAHIIRTRSCPGRRFCMIAGLHNDSSRRGILKAGFREAGKIRKTIARRYIPVSGSLAGKV